MNRQEFNEVIAPFLGAIFESNGKPLPSDAVKSLWFMALKSHDAKTVFDAITAHVSRPAQSYGMVQPNDIVLLIEGSPDERAGLAWQKFLTAARSKSSYLSIAFDDPYIHATVKFMGGWVKLTEEMEESAREQYRRIFDTSYKLFLKGGLPEDTPLRLPGVVENHRILNGLNYDEAVQLVGDKATAQLLADGQHPALPLRRPAVLAASVALGAGGD